MISVLLVCTVLSVHDGDTLTARCEDRVHKVRLTEIDAPERGQPYARQSTSALKTLCLRMEATIQTAGPDRYGRTLGRVHCRGTDANMAQVQAGLAWAFDKYLTDPAIKTAADEARAARRGLWQSNHPINPGDYRAARHH